MTEARIASLAKRVAELEDEVAKLTVVTIGLLAGLHSHAKGRPLSGSELAGLLDIIAPEAEEEAT